MLAATAAKVVRSNPGSAHSSSRGVNVIVRIGASALGRHGPRMVKSLIRLAGSPGSRISTSLPIARACGFRQWIHRVGPLAWKIESHSLSPGDFFHLKMKNVI
jgi:hypothetical protein